MRRILFGALLCCASGTLAAGEPQLNAVGQLLVPGTRFEEGRRRHYDERCSATLVSASIADRSTWLLTAWHCLEYYRDLSRDITYIHSDGGSATAREVASGGGMHADWALLQLDVALPHPTALRPTAVEPGMSIVLAGYSKQQPMPANLPLQVDRSCVIVASEGPDLASDCRARQGASGGAVFASKQAGGHYLGVVSRGDGTELSIFVPLRRLEKALRRHLESPASP